MSSPNKLESLKRPNSSEVDGSENVDPCGKGDATNGESKRKPIQLNPKLAGMIKESLKDVDVDSDDDDDVENDKELLSELKEISGKGKKPEAAAENTDEPSTSTITVLSTTALNTARLIEQRIEMYKQADAKATIAGEAEKTSRFERGLKTLEDMLKQALAGDSINVDDIPPEVSIKEAGKSATEEEEAA